MKYCSDVMRDNIPMIDKVLRWENKQCRGGYEHGSTLDFF